MALSGRVSRSRKRPTSTASRKLTKKNEYKTKDGKKWLNWRGSIPMDDGSSLSVTITTDTAGKLKVSDDTRKEGNKITWLEVAEFESDSI